ncbi:hypothetical protein DXG01_013902 [Tephrocybe rancida]|nr:hypothetical protein DXG01_013902 [Tephrocybe rancida]
MQFLLAGKQIYGVYGKFPIRLPAEELDSPHGIVCVAVDQLYAPGSAWTSDFSNVPALDSDVLACVPPLNTAPLYLTTDLSNSAVAAFYIPTNPTLFLAKSGHLNDEDHAATALFLDHLKEANYFEDVTPFLVRYGTAKVNKLRETSEEQIEELRREVQVYEPHCGVSDEKGVQGC